MSLSFYIRRSGISFRAPSGRVRLQVLRGVAALRLRLHELPRRVAAAAAAVVVHSKTLEEAPKRCFRCVLASFKTFRSHFRSRKPRRTELDEGSDNKNMAYVEVRTLDLRQPAPIEKPFGSSLVLKRSALGVRQVKPQGGCGLDLSRDTISKPQGPCLPASIHLI